MKHLMFLSVDHFEPRADADVTAWVEGYPRVAKRFTDAGGNHPKHTWFYEREEPGVLDALGGLCREKLGEIEVHLHHGHDTADGLREKLERRKRIYAEHGALVTAEASPRHTFGFIHGKWSLDNSRGNEHCGVNNEITVLRECGCYADFTFPAWGRMQPRKSRAIYYAIDDPQQSKSYDDGPDAQVGKSVKEGLMIISGPSSLSGFPRKLIPFSPVAWLADRMRLTCALDGHLPPWPGRIDRWVRANVHVKGQPDWVFVKVHTHGARPANYGPFLETWAQRLHAHLTSRYNDAVAWRLHYVTAREAYNLVKAAEAGRTGDPEAYRDFEIAPYQNTR